MEKMKIALVGAGTWGQSHANIYAEYSKVKIAAICDINVERALRMAEKHGISRDSVFSDYNDMLQKGDFDAVAIITPDFLHRDIAIACANAGKHMLIEKPLATNEKDVMDIYNAVRKNKVRAMVDFHNRWNPPFALMKSDLDSGKYGEPYSAYIRLNDIRWVATDLLPWAAQSSILWFLGSHSLDTLRWLFNDEVKKIYAVARSGILKRAGVDTVDVYQSILEFRNGGIATMENGWITPNTNPNVNDFKCNLMCTEGMFSLDLSSHNLIQRIGADGVKVPDILVNNFVHDRAMGFAYQSIRHFVDCILNDKPFYVSLEDAANVSLTILKIFEAVEKGTPVDVSLPDWKSCL
jgi:predicted dehydrogenase